MDLSGKSNTQIDALIANHERQGATDRPLYAAALEERDRRRSFSFETSLAVIERAARAGQFVAYKDIADANGVDWNVAYRTIPAHLGDLVRWSHGRFGFLVSAIVVAKDHLQDGAMREETLAGFVRATEMLGVRVENPEAFLRSEQRAVFDHYRNA